MDSTINLSFEIYHIGHSINKTKAVGTSAVEVDLDEVIEFLTDFYDEIHSEDFHVGCEEFLVDVNNELPRGLVAEFSDEELNKLRRAVYEKMKLNKDIIFADENEIIKSYYN